MVNNGRNAQNISYKSFEKFIAVRMQTKSYLVIGNFSCVRAHYVQYAMGLVLKVKSKVV